MTGVPLVVLLRAVNVGGRNRVAMAGLRDDLTRRLGVPVTTYLQSGNVLVPAGGPGPAEVVREVEASLLDGFGITTTAVVLTATELQRIVEATRPLLDGLADAKQLQVMILTGVPAEAGVAELRGRSWGEDTLHLGEGYVAFRYASSMHESSLQAAPVAKKLRVEGTARNHRVLTALLDRSLGG